MLATGTSWSGDINGQVTYAYDNDFRVTGITVNGGATRFIKPGIFFSTYRCGRATGKRQP